jgi:porphyrinogen peroxidase
MLSNMFVGNPPGNYDRILDFSTAVTGNLFFVPTSDFLDDPPTPNPEPVLRPEGSDVGLQGRSLAIGSLKHHPS